MLYVVILLKMLFFEHQTKKRLKLGVGASNKADPRNRDAVNVVD